MANTKKGEKLLKELNEKNIIMLVERPIEEPIKVQNQLNQPSIKTKQHDKFMKKYIKYKDFEMAAKKSMKIDLICNKYKLTGMQKKIRRVKRLFTKK